MPAEATPTNTDTESPPTAPTKTSTRQTRSRGSLLTESPASSDRDAADVEATPIARKLTPPLPPSSDDFEGY